MRPLIQAGDPLIDQAIPLAIKNIERNLREKFYTAGEHYLLPWLRDTYEGGIIPSFDTESIKVYLDGIEFWADRQGKEPIYTWEEDPKYPGCNRLEPGQICTNRLSGEYDESLIFITSILEAYLITGEQKFLSHLKNCEEAWNFGMQSVPEGHHLIYAKPLVASDWADQINRRGFCTNLEALWYQATKSLALLEEIVGNKSRAGYLHAFGERIKSEINFELFRASSPLSRNAPGIDKPFGHYIGWKFNNHQADYFEMCSNFRCILLGIAGKSQVESITSFVDKNFSYLMGGRDSLPPAAKVVYGDYDPRDYAAINDAIADGKYQNQYWASVGAMVATAYSGIGNFSAVRYALRNIAKALIEGESSSTGIFEWYHNDGRGSGSKWFQWAARAFLNALYKGYLGLTLEKDRVSVNPVSGGIAANITYMGKRIRVEAEGDGSVIHVLVGNQKIVSGKIPGKLLKDGTSVYVKLAS